MTKRYDRDQITKRVTAELQRGLDTAHRATSVGHDICVLMTVLGLSGDTAVEEMRNRWRMLVQTEFPDLVTTTAEYFVRLARNDGELAFEEIAKLISLATDLHVLDALGMVIPAELFAECTNALRERVARQRQIKAVASGLVHPWSRELWCYSLLLG
jgi:hypothetical protein